MIKRKKWQTEALLLLGDEKVLQDWVDGGNSTVLSILNAANVHFNTLKHPRELDATIEKPFSGMFLPSVIKPNRVKS